MHWSCGPSIPLSLSVILSFVSILLVPYHVRTSCFHSSHMQAPPCDPAGMLQKNPETASTPHSFCSKEGVSVRKPNSWLPGAIVIGTPKEREVIMSLTAQGTYVSCPQHTFLAVTGLHVNSGIPHCQPGTFPPHFPQFGVYSFVCSFVCMSVHLSIHFFNVKPTIHPSNAHRAYTGAACFFSFSPGSLRCRKVEGWEGRLWFPCPP